ncbi:GNAT family N-acetyltransferase [Leeia sp. TBRC 13508]|uniref:GNAT family N-acetyltransferase n=1 Tax=Leeia speluncae TaxID=2884804 RepID=A0ABS8D8M3_9NEIS|nr:GNAT family N-acetyltransferase [Leeia speluncae]MCB6184519.1 GNAT family N-acetyltransferase [Leeia speluncae]
MSSPIHIQLVRPTDFNAWLLLWQGYQAFYQTDIPESVTQQTWDRFLTESEPMHSALAWQDNQAIGMVNYIEHRSCWTKGDYVYLQDLFVSPSCRGGGVGRKLIEHVYQHATHISASRVWWLTHETNQDAMKLYDKIANRPGFVQYRHLIG